MKLSRFDIDNVNYWHVYTDSINDMVVDIAIINYGTHRLELIFKFPRFKSLCYFEPFRDYAESYSSSIEYIELINQLRTEAPYLLNMHTPIMETMYG
jgi:hypothetical protein